MATPNYGWNLPTVGADADAWGDELNTTFGDIDADLKTVSDVAYGALESFPGQITAYGGTTAPTGWLMCNGAAVSRTTYSALFGIIGTAYGVGDGSTTFNVPELRGEFLRGNDNGRGVDTSRVLGSAQADELKAHTHTAPATTSVDRGNGGQATAGQFGTTTTSSTGGTETRPRNVSVNFIIKT